jgi:hypothetical protein
MNYHRADMEQQMRNFRPRLEAEINGALCYLSKRGLEIVLPRAFRKQEHLDVFDRLVAIWGAGFFTHRRTAAHFAQLFHDSIPYEPSS